MKSKSDTFICMILAISLMFVIIKNAEVGWSFHYVIKMEQQRSELVDMTRRALVQQKLDHLKLQAQIDAMRAPCDRRDFVIKPEDMR